MNTRLTSFFSSISSFFKTHKTPAFVYRPDPKAPGQSFMELEALAHNYDDDRTADLMADTNLIEKEKISQLVSIVNQGVAGDTPTLAEYYEGAYPHLSRCGQLFHPDELANPKRHSWEESGVQSMSKSEVLS